MSDELFSFPEPQGDPAEPQPLDHLPLAARMAPQTIGEFAGQEHILGPGKMLRRLIEADRVTSLLFFGPPGSGKTSLARFIAARSNARVEEINAVAAGIADLKKALEAAKYLASHTARRTLLLIDEIHHFNRTQQDVLLPSVERGEVILIGMTTENPSFYVNAALLSRFTPFEFKPLEDHHLHAILESSLTNMNRGVGKERLEVSPEAKEHLVRMCGGDARRLLNAIELAALSTPLEIDGKRRISLSVAEESIQKRAVRYDKKSDDHYDHISAFIKSMRGSDPDAAVYWMAKMLAAGEDPRFIARRILICSSEDVGNADFRALIIASAALQAVESLGMPEARIPLAQAAIYIACAPKSNASYNAINRAIEEVNQGPSREVPLHLRDATMDSKSRGHGVGYKYAHDFPNHYVPQEYMPQPVEFYRLSDQGDEQRLADRLRKLKSGVPPRISEGKNPGA